MTDVRTPDPAPVSTRPVPAHKPGYVPGQKRARHQRWTRVTKWATLGGLAILVGLGAFVLPRLFDKPTLAESQGAGIRDFLSGVAHQVGIFAGARNRLPTTLAELRDPDLPSVYDAEPWDVWGKPIEYRVLDEGKRTFQLRSRGPDKTPDTPDDVIWPVGSAWAR